MATGKKKDPYEYARDHQSAPLSSLKDPDSFGPPPRNKDYQPDGEASNQPGRWTAAGPVPASIPEGPSGGLGSVVHIKTRQEREQEAAQKQAEEQAVQQRPSGPYQIDSSGLRTDNLPKPPVRRNGPESPASAASPSMPLRGVAPRALPPRVSSPSLPPRQNAKPAAPAPVLPPRQNEYPDEHTPAPPPPYSEPGQTAPQPVGSINLSAVNRLGQAGVSVPGFGIGGQSTSATHAASQAPQLNELQQRFARLNHEQTPSSGSSSSLPGGLAATAVAAAKKGPPPPPPRKSTLIAGASHPSPSGADHPPPLPLSSKPKPT